MEGLDDDLEQVVEGGKRISYWAMPRCQGGEEFDEDSVGGREWSRGG